MQYFLKRLSDGVLFSTSQLATWDRGVWYGGNLQELDTTGLLFVAVAINPGNATTATTACMITSLQRQAAKAAKAGDSYTATKLLLQASQLGAV